VTIYKQVDLGVEMTGITNQNLQTVRFETWLIIYFNILSYFRRFPQRFIVLFLKKVNDPKKSQK
jgi:hypothetical protein